MGAIQGLFAAQYDLLRKRDTHPLKHLTKPWRRQHNRCTLVAENGMDWMYANCSTTAQRGALDWWKKFRDAVAPVFEELYESVATGKEAKITIEANQKATYREGLEKELNELRNQMWRTGATSEKLRPENK